MYKSTSSNYGIATMILAVLLCGVIIALSIQNNKLNTRVKILKHHSESDMIKTIEVNQNGVHLVALKSTGEDSYTHLYYTLTFKEAEKLHEVIKVYKDNNPDS